jgi:pterin-4a-carbinolamine dehydratase
MFALTTHTYTTCSLPYASPQTCVRRRVALDRFDFSPSLTIYAPPRARLAHHPSISLQLRTVLVSNQSHQIIHRSLLLLRTIQLD